MPQSIHQLTSNKMTTTNAILAPEPLLLPHEHSTEARWSFGTRFAFRFCCAYALMQWVTLCVWLLTPTVALGLLGRPDFYGPLTAQLGEWLMALILNLPEHSPPRLSGNFLPHFLGIMAVAAISAVGALVWSALDRGRTKAHPRLFVWLHTLMRFLLGATMLWYGWAKLLPVQFAMTLDYMALEVAQHNPRDLLWAFMIGSRDYQNLYRLRGGGGRPPPVDATDRNAWGDHLDGGDGKRARARHQL